MEDGREPVRPEPAESAPAVARRHRWPSRAARLPQAAGDVRRVSIDPGPLPATIRAGLGILGFFGLADVVAHLGTPTVSGPASADAGQLVAHLGVLLGMTVVAVGLVVEGLRAGRASQTTGGVSGRPPAEAAPTRGRRRPSTRSRGREAHDAVR